jgi:hypothetical protein
MLNTEAYKQRFNKVMVFYPCAKLEGANKYINDRINKVITFIREQRLGIDVNACPKLLQELQGSK